MFWETLPDPAKFVAARTLPSDAPGAAWLRTMVERVRDAFNPRRAPREWPADWADRVFWFQPVQRLSTWIPAKPYSYEAVLATPAGRGGLDRAALAHAAEFLRRFDPAVAHVRLSAHGYIDRPRRSKPHARVNLVRFQGKDAWEVGAWFDLDHPRFQKGESVGAVTAEVRQPLGGVDAGPNAFDYHPTRSGLADPDDAFERFLAVAGVAVPCPTAWWVEVDLKAPAWPKWVPALDAYSRAWTYGGAMHPPHGFDPFARPALFEPGRPLRVPVGRWPEGAFPKLQLDLVHAPGGTWLEFQSPRGRTHLEAVEALVRPLEFWDGPPRRGGGIEPGGRPRVVHRAGGSVT